MNRPIIALDFSSKSEIADFLTYFPATEALYVKVGMELYYQEGPAIVTWLKKSGHEVFLDLKLHDIPTTVQKAMQGLAKLGVNMTNVHAAGGKKMMEAALKGLSEGTSKKLIRPTLLAVTQLTSTSEAQMQQDQLILTSLEESVIHYAKSAAEAGLDGVVCSALEVANIKKAVSSPFICLTPGIRLKNAGTDDQKRIVTPKKAHEIGSDYIVVGRPVTQAKNPYQSYLEIKSAWNGETNG